jgi:hypothetical protein
MNKPLPVVLWRIAISFIITTSLLGVISYFSIARSDAYCGEVESRELTPGPKNSLLIAKCEATHRCTFDS